MLLCSTAVSKKFFDQIYLSGKLQQKKSDRRPQITVPVLKRLSASIAFPYRETISVSCGELFRYSSLLLSLLTAKTFFPPVYHFLKRFFAVFLWLSSHRTISKFPIFMNLPIFIFHKPHTSVICSLTDQSENKK